MELRLAYRGAGEPRRIDVLVFGESLVVAQRLRVRVVAGGSLVDRLADDLHPRPREHAGVDRVADIDGIESAARIHVENGGKAGFKIDLRVRQRDQRALGGRVGRVEIQVDVPVDHARKHGRQTEVEHGRAGGNLQPRADFGDALAPDDDHLVGEHPARPGVEQPPRPDRDHLVRRRQEFPGLRRRRGGSCASRRSLPLLRPHAGARGSRNHRDEHDDELVLTVHGPPLSRAEPIGATPYVTWKLQESGGQ